MVEQTEIKSFRDLVKKVLNTHHILGLSSEVKIFNKSQRVVVFDLADQSHLVFVDIVEIESSSTRPNNLINAKRNFDFIANKFDARKYKYFTVFFEEITKNDRLYYNRSLKSSKTGEYIILDNTDILSLAKKYDISTDYQDVVLTSESKIATEQKESVKKKIFLVNSNWGDVDQMERFINESIWENGYNNKYLELVNSVNSGDLLLMKSTHSKKNDNILRLKAYGHVVNNSANGKRLNVKWIPLHNHIDISNLGHYRDAIVSPNERVELLVLDELTKKNPRFLQDFDKSNYARISRESISNASQGNYERLYLLKLIKEVLNKQYHLNLEIQESKSIYSTINKIDLFDKPNKAFASFCKGRSKHYKKINLDDSLAQEVDVHTTLAEIFSGIKSDIDVLQQNDELVKYFVIFDESFKQKEIEIIKEWSSHNKFNYHPVVLGINDILELGQEHNIDFSKFKDTINNSDTYQIENSSDKVPFHLDQVVDEDKLGREPVAKAFVDLLKKDIFTEKLNHSFMVHLQGKWGAGKSSFLNFIKKNLNSDEGEWIIVEYNAWQNQHISPPWWSLINQVYLKSKEQLNWRACFHLWRKEIVRRIWRYNGWQKIIAFLIFTISIICVIYFVEDLLNIFQQSTEVVENGKNVNKKIFTNKLVDFGKLVLTISSLLGALYGFTKFITIPFFINSSKDAKSFVLKASDPMNQVKKHFNDLVDNINSTKKKRQLAIFIDDIDRCDKEFIVNLLEGIQTLFKDKKVLYIVAGDKNWISTSFGNTYEEFATEQVDKQKLGEFFIEKAFQLSFRLPNISEESKQNYWDHILGIENNEKSIKINSINELTEDKQDELKSDLKESKSELTNPKFVQGLQEKYNLSGDTVSNIVIEEKNKDTEELKHLLQEYHRYIDTNPRSIIRLANNYTMARSILMAERVNFNEHKLFRWLVIEDLCPEVKSIITNTENISEFEKIIKSSKDIVKRKNSKKLLKGKDEFMEGEIEIEDIKVIKGI
jgi:uncharacterized protein YhbP (UPF0306 family)